MVGKGKRKQPSRAGAATRASKRVKAEERGVERSVEVWPGRSVWQEPPHPVLETILDHLLAQPCGKRWVRWARSAPRGAQGSLGASKGGTVARRGFACPAFCWCCIPRLVFYSGRS